jgi:predicted Rossmann fold flavoprotein
VLVLEKMNEPARKLRITGKGRCNLTNTEAVPAFIDRFGRDGRFLRQAFARFFSSDLVAFFEGLGVRVVEERGGRVFPKSGRAPEVAAALLDWARRAGVVITTGDPVASLIVADGRVVGVRTAGGVAHRARAVIVATGGRSYPLTGSTGDGYALARAVGHTIVPTRPALVPLESPDVPRDQLADLNLRNISVRVTVDGKTRASKFGELVFTATGLGGPIILTVSGLAVDALAAGNQVAVVVDFKPALDERKLDARLLRDIDRDGHATVRALLEGLLPRQIIPFCLASLDLAADKPLHQVTATERKALRAWLKGCAFRISGSRPMDEAIVTAGGVALKEVEPKTMASRLVPGLYFAGEVLDLAGDTGGYNLQAAFSTGYLAGIAVAE